MWSRLRTKEFLGEAGSNGVGDVVGFLIKGGRSKGGRGDSDDRWRGAVCAIGVRLRPSPRPSPTRVGAVGEVRVLARAGEGEEARGGVRGEVMWWRVCRVSGRGRGWW
jgi:hypothetical protein